MSTTVVRVDRLQRLAALEKANAVRTASVAVRRELAAGTISLSDALEDPRAQALKVSRLLGAQRSWGSEKVRRLLTPLDIRGERRVRTLSSSQRLELARFASMSARAREVGLRERRAREQRAMREAQGVWGR